MADEAVTLAVGTGQRSNEGLARRVWGEVKRRKGASQDGAEKEKMMHEAQLELERSLEVFGELGMELETGRTLLEMAQLHQQVGRLDPARQVAEKARAIFEKLEARGDLKQAGGILSTLEGSS